MQTTTRRNVALCLSSRKQVSRGEIRLPSRLKPNCPRGLGAACLPCPELTLHETGEATGGRNAGACRPGYGSREGLQAGNVDMRVELIGRDIRWRRGFARFFPGVEARHIPPRGHRGDA